jgi:hypothetical protein
MRVREKKSQAGSKLARLAGDNGTSLKQVRSRRDLDEASHREKSHVDVFSILRPLC